KSPSKGGAFVLSDKFSFLRIQKASQLARAGRVFELTQGFGFDLTDTFAGDRELLSDFFQRVIRVHADTETHAQNAFFAGGEGGHDAVDRLAQVLVDCSIQRLDRGFVLDKVAQL